MFLDSYALSGEPIGYAGLEWGSGIESAKDMVFKQQDPDNPDIFIYANSQETFLWHGIFLDRIDYVFNKGKFCSVLLFAKGPEKANTLKSKLYELYGNAWAMSGVATLAEWRGDKTDIRFTYATDKEETIVQFLSKEYGQSGDMSRGDRQHQ